MTAPVEHRARLVDWGVMCSCGRLECPDMTGAVRTGAPVDPAFVWHLELALAAGRTAAIRYVAGEVRARRVGAALAADALAAHDPTLRTDLELELARHPRR